MTNKTITFKVLPYFPIRFVWVFAISLVSLYSLVENKYWLLAATVILIIVCMTTQYRVDVSPSNKWFKEYVWILGMKNGDLVKFSQLDYLFINKGKVTQTVGSRVQSTTVTKDEYRGFIKFDDDEKIHILTHSNHDKLVKMMSSASHTLQTRLFDYSSGQAVQVV